MKINRSSLKRVVPMFLIGFVFLIGQASSAFGQLNSEILARMDRHNKALTSLRANVTMVKVNAQLGGVEETNEGKVAYLPIKGKDPAVRIDWIRPQESLAVIDKKYVIYRPGLKQAYVGTTDSAKGNAKAGSALAFMNMSRAELKANYDITNLGEETLKKSGTKTWHLQMIPKARTSYKSADVWVDADGMPVQSKVTEHNGDSTTIVLTNIQKNVKVDGSEFRIKLPSDTKEIKA